MPLDLAVGCVVSPFLVDGTTLGARVGWVFRHMSERARAIYGCKLVWAAMSLTGAGTRPDGVDSAAEFVAGLGARGVGRFQEELEALYRESEAAGLTQRLALLWERKDRREPTAAELRGAVQRVACLGRSWFARALEDPASAEAAETFGESGEGMDEALARRLRLVEAPSEYVRHVREVPPMRPDGSPWISFVLGLGVGVDGNADWPFRGKDFHSALNVSAARASLSPLWAEMRARRKLGALDIVVEYWRSPDAVRPLRIEDMTPRRTHVFTSRNPPTGSPESSPFLAGQAEAEALLRDCYRLVEGLG